MDTVSRILLQCGEPDAPLPPTEPHNEGWMLRLLLDFLSRHPGSSHPLSPTSGARWASEVLLPSRFLAVRRGDPLAEGFTHADGIVGHFAVRRARGDVEIEPNARQLLVIEAKLGSPLSSGTRRAPEFDQAARNVACLAHIGAHVPQLSFYVVAPQAQIAAGIFGELVTAASISSKVKSRCDAYAGAHDAWYSDTFVPTLARMQVAAVSWEDVLDQLPDTGETRTLRDFYERCLRFNPSRSFRGDALDGCNVGTASA